MDELRKKLTNLLSGTEHRGDVYITEAMAEIEKYTNSAVTTALERVKKEVIGKNEDPNYGQQNNFLSLGRINRKRLHRNGLRLEQRKALYTLEKELGKEVTHMPEEQNNQPVGESVEDRVRRNLASILSDLREEQKTVGQSPRGRAISIAITELEITSKVIIWSFYANEPYSPLKKLQPVPKE